MNTIKPVENANTAPGRAGLFFVAGRLVFAAAAAVSCVGCVSGSSVLSFYPPPVFATRSAATISVTNSIPIPLPAPPLLTGRRPMRSVVVDAGHGGTDPGALGVGPLPEKAVNLAIAEKLARILRAKGFDVTTTRTSDRFIPLDDRAALADETASDLFVSVHADSHPRPDVTGATVYIARDASRASVQSAQAIVAALRRSGIECRGVRRAGFRVLVGHSRPSVLVECGYLTNRFESARLSNGAYQSKLAAALASGISQHLAR